MLARHPSSYGLASSSFGRGHYAGKALTRRGRFLWVAPSQLQARDIADIRWIEIGYAIAKR
jgi:hypothetical protein